jgi:serine/threonine protein kinase
MGVVFAGYDEDLDRKVAVKLLHAERAGGTVGRQRLMREAQAMARLSHPNVVQVYEVGTFEDQVYVAMEFVQGQTLRQWQAEPDRRWREIVQTYVDAGRGLAAAHEAGIVHRDFKPDNVLVGDDGRVCVLDFGLARGAEGAELSGGSEPVASRSEHPRTAVSDDSLSARLTQTGAVMGTPAYMSPEQHRGGVTDATTDQFSFCVSLYEALYGERPFKGETLAMLAHSVLEGTVADAPRYTEVPARIRAVLLRGLAKRPVDRHDSMAALLDALERDERRRRRQLGVVASALAVGVLVAATGLLWRAVARPRVDLEAERDAVERALERATYREADRAHQRAQVSEHWDALVLAYARGRLDADPTKALASLVELTPGNRSWLGAASMIAARPR